MDSAQNINTDPEGRRLIRIPQFDPSDKKHILYLFDRPNEPLSLSKGEDIQVQFSVPPSFLPERYRPAPSAPSSDGEAIAVQYSSMTIGNNIPIAPLANIPDLSLPLSLSRQESFSLFIPQHRTYANELIRILMKQETFEEFKSLVAYCRDRMNTYLFIYALSVCLLHRPDCKGIQLPYLSEILPEKFIDKSAFPRIKEELNFSPESRKPVLVKSSATDMDIENRLAYFREDIGVNLHHWHWHLVYPNSGDFLPRDRRGELFYYMHQQILARYNTERLCNKLLRTRKLNNLKEPIPEGYFPKLDQSSASQTYPPRFKNTVLSDINRDPAHLKFEIADLNRYRDRILVAIHTNTVVTPEGKFVPLTEETGIDTLGNMIEASDLSVNKQLYGDLHNFGHIAIAFCHDPDYRYLELSGLMGDVATAMRDPVFYRWHEEINSIFMEHKNTLKPYTEEQLGYDSVSVKSVEVTAEGVPKNEFSTFWQQTDVNLSKGLDFAARGAIYARFTHLQHTPYTVKINVENNGSLQRKATVRIFLASKLDESHAQMKFLDQKNLFIELDRFVVDLDSKNKVIERASVDSAVTIPYNVTFRDLNANPGKEGSEEADKFDFCGCGWPQHMLIPKGTASGFPCQLFVMVSDYEQDKVENDESKSSCKKNASSYCGIRDSKYPDKRPMGFPFDRMPRAGKDTLEKFLTPNMAVQEVKIKFTDKVEIGNTKG